MVVNQREMDQSHGHKHETPAGVARTREFATSSELCERNVRSTASTLSKRQRIMSTADEHTAQQDNAEAQSPETKRNGTMVYATVLRVGIVYTFTSVIAAYYAPKIGLLKLIIAVCKLRGIVCAVRLCAAISGMLTAFVSTDKNCSVAAVALNVVSLIWICTVLKVGSNLPIVFSSWHVLRDLALVSCSSFALYVLHAKTPYAGKVPPTIPDDAPTTSHAE